MYQITGMMALEWKTAAGVIHVMFYIKLLHFGHILYIKSKRNLFRKQKGFCFPYYRIEVLY